MIEKPINLVSLVDSYYDLPNDIYYSYKASKNISIKDSEIEDLESLTNYLGQHLDQVDKVAQVFDNFYVGFTIKQISKEFDLLRLGNDYTVNIELKKRSSKERIFNQLKRSHHFLSVLKGECYCFTYVSESQELYSYDVNTNEIKLIEVGSLIDILLSQDILHVEDINSLFDPTNYLVSPFNSTDRFVNGEYFLTNHQEEIKETILNAHNNIMSIEGKAGTGKSLLVYDIAKHYKDEGNRLGVIHCANLNIGHEKLRFYHGWRINPIKGYDKILDGNLDLLIIDEAQRLRRSQFENIVNNAKEKEIKCIFAYDPNQRLNRNEFLTDISKEIIKETEDNHFSLTGKIRTNKEISSFLHNMFNLNNVTPDQDYTNIEIQYFSDTESSKNFIEHQTELGWTFINYTPAQYGVEFTNQFLIDEKSVAHEVIGQEFDNVVVVLGEMFDYDEKGNLRSTKESYYDLWGMLLQIVSRARKRLLIVVVSNKSLLTELLRIKGEVE